MNIVEYFEKEAKKSKGLVSHDQILFRVGQYYLQYKRPPSESGYQKQPVR